MILPDSWLFQKRGHVEPVFGPHAFEARTKWSYSHTATVEALCKAEPVGSIMMYGTNLVDSASAKQAKLNKLFWGLHIAKIKFEHVYFMVFWLSKWW